MANHSKTMSEMGLEKLSDRFSNSLNCLDDDNVNKPDFRELDLGSPISPLQRRNSGPSNASTATTSSSSSSGSSGSISGRNGPGFASKKSDSNHSAEFPRKNNHSGELSSSVETSQAAGRGFKKGHNRSYSSGSYPLTYSGGSSANSPISNVLPAGNICPSGRILKTGMAKATAKSDIMGSRTCNYGHGSIVRAGVSSKIVNSSGLDSGSVGGGGSPQLGESKRRGGMSNSHDPEELKRIGNEYYKKGQFVDALDHYDNAVAFSPGNATYHFNRAAALMGLRRVMEAVRACEEAIGLDPGYVRAHHRLGSLLLSLGNIESAQKHLCFPGHQADPVEIQKLQVIEKHLSRCKDFRRVGDWRNTLKEADVVIASGADSCSQIMTCRAEALLKLHQVDDAELCLSSISKFQQFDVQNSQLKFFGIVSDAYLLFVRAQIELALGRFENALNAAEKAGQIDPWNVEVSGFLSNVRFVSRARARGNELFKSERFTEACSAYGEGLKLDPSNSVLYCNRAACWYKLGQWEKSVHDCNQALIFHPDYTKALLRKAASNSKLEKWVEAVRDYEILKRKLPDDNEVTESLFHAQLSLRKSRGEDVSNMKFGGGMVLILSLEQFRAAIASPVASVVYFLAPANTHCKQISPVLDTLCSKYPNMNFFKVNVEESPSITDIEKIRVVPTFKIYKNGARVKEMICPSPDALESSIRHYSS